MKTSDVYQAHDGEWVRLKRRDFNLACCDCGSVHRMRIRVRRGRVEIQCFQDPERTAELRAADAALVRHDGGENAAPPLPG
jgi:hypothetical protein